MMSDKVVLRPVVTEDNAIQIIDDFLTIDFSIAIRQVNSNGVKSDVQLVASESNEVNTFVALFDDNDIDFEIEVHNRSLTKNMGFDMTYVEKYSYFARRGTGGVFEALEDNGHHLRFMSPNLPMAQLIVNILAAGGMARKEAEMVCSRIRFDMEVEINRVSRKPSMGQVIQVFVEPIGGETVNAYIGRENTVYDLKRRLQDIVDIPPEQQRLLDCGRQLPDSHTIKELNIQRKSILEMALKMCGGGDSSDAPIHPLSSTQTQAFGRRGVVGFGRQTGQKFRDYRGFIADEDYIIEPFFIEFRLKK